MRRSQVRILLGVLDLRRFVSQSVTHSRCSRGKDRKGAKSEQMDWKCKSCDKVNRGNAQLCGDCGASLNDSVPAWLRWVLAVIKVLTSR